MLLLFKQQCSVFKQHYSYFYIFFHPYVFSKNINNVIRNFLSNISLKMGTTITILNNSIDCQTVIKSGMRIRVKAEWKTLTKERFGFGHLVLTNIPVDMRTTCRYAYFDRKSLVLAILCWHLTERSGGLESGVDIKLIHESLSLNFKKYIDFKLQSGDFWNLLGKVVLR